MRNSNKKPLEDALKRFKANTGFRMTNVQIQGNAPQEYLHTPLKFVIQMQGSSFDPLLNTHSDRIVQPEPSMTLSEIKELQKHQRLDVTALVKTVREPRKVTDTRCVVDVVIMDESARDYAVQDLKWSYWMNIPPEKEQSATLTLLRESEGKRKPLFFRT